MSLGSFAIYALMRVLRYKNKLLKKITAGVDKSKPCVRPPEKMYKEFSIEDRVLEDCPVYTIRSEKPPEASVLFFHGGSYVNHFNKRHWKMLGFLARRANVEIHAVDYPLAPAFTHKDTFDKMTRIYRRWIENTALPAIILGDSAGGGIALALNLWAAENGVKRPDRLILLSPAVDLTMENPDIPSIQKRDPFLHLEAIRLCAQAYAGGMDLKTYTLSPAYGDLAQLCKTDVFTGTRDLLYPDIALFCDKLAQLGIPSETYTYPNMLHDFPVFNFKEAKKAKKQIADILNREIACQKNI